MRYDAWMRQRQRERAEVQRAFAAFLGVAGWCSAIYDRGYERALYRPMLRPYFAGFARWVE